MERLPGDKSTKEDESEKANYVNKANDPNKGNLTYYPGLEENLMYFDKDEMDDFDEEMQMQIDLNEKKVENGPLKIMNCEFVFSCVRESNFLGIKNLIRPAFQYDNVSLAGVVDIIVSINTLCGSTIKPEENDQSNIIGIFSILPFYKFKDNPAIEQIKEMLRSKCQNNIKTKNALEKVFKKSVAYLINERVINLPQQLIYPGLNLLTNEIYTNFQDEELKKEFWFDYFILSTKFTKPEKISKKKKKKANKEEKLIIEECMFYKEEILDFIFLSEFYFEWKIPTEDEFIEEGRNIKQAQYMLYVVVSSENFYKVVYSNET